MITQRDIMPKLLRACPSYSLRWENYRRDWASDHDTDSQASLIDGQYLLHPALGDFARHLIILLFEKTMTQEFAATFATLEQLLIEGDKETRNAVIVGLLEGIQNISLHQGYDYRAFTQFLLPETAKAWQGLIDFWNPENSPPSD